MSEGGPVVARGASLWRARLALGGPLLAVGAGLVPLAADYLMERSKSLAGNLGLEAGLMLLVFMGAYLVALGLLSRLAPRRFGGPRLLDVHPPTAHAPLSDDDLSPVSRTGSLPFAALLVALIVGGVALGNTLGDGVLFRQREIRLRTALRGDEPARRARVAREIAQIEFRDPLVDFVPRLWALSKSDPDPEVRTACLWSLAQIAERMRKSVLIRHTEREVQGWERELLDQMSATLAAPAMARFPDEPAQAQRPLLRLLAHTAPERAIDLALIYLNHPEPSPELLTDLAYLLGQAGTLRATEALNELAARDEEGVRAVAIVSEARLLRFFEPEKRGEEIPESAAFVRRVERDLGKPTAARLCPALEALHYLKDARQLKRLTQIFDDPERAALVCPRVEVDDPLRGGEVLITEEEVAYKALRAMADIALGGPEVEAYLRGVLTRRTDLSARMRREIEHVLMLIGKAEETP